MALRTGRSSRRAINWPKNTSSKRIICGCVSYPFTREVHDFIERHERVYVVEQNRDGQMASLLKLDIKAELTPRLRSICHIHGLPIDARSVTDELMMMEGK